jgi:hypothetical protein
MYEPLFKDKEEGDDETLTWISAADVGCPFGGGGVDIMFWVLLNPTDDRKTEVCYPTVHH